jgi:hypothetical protein
MLKPFVMKILKILADAVASRAFYTNYKVNKQKKKKKKEEKNKMFYIDYTFINYSLH